MFRRDDITVLPGQAISAFRAIAGPLKATSSAIRARDKHGVDAVAGWTPEDHPRSVKASRTNDDTRHDEAQPRRIPVNKDPLPDGHSATQACCANGL